YDVVTIDEVGVVGTLPNPDRQILLKPNERGVDYRSRSAKLTIDPKVKPGLVDLPRLNRRTRWTRDVQGDNARIHVCQLERVHEYGRISPVTTLIVSQDQSGHGETWRNT